MKQENPFPLSLANRRFHTYDYALKTRYGKKVFKVPLDGGFTCPNIDGSCGTGGCTYCNLALLYPERTQQRHAGEPPHRFPVPPLRTQFDQTRQKLHEKWPDADYIVYFQNFTNTYGEEEEVETMLREALSFEHVVGLNVATRADALSQEMIARLRRLARETDLTVELGLQTIHDETAQRIHRGHSYADFLDTYRKLEGLQVCVHIINGLPGESHDMMLQTAREMARLHPYSLKIHLLHVLRGTAMETLYLSGQLRTLTKEEYVTIVCDQIEWLPPEIIIARITGDGIRAQLTAPDWSTHKFIVMNEIDKEFVRRGTFQGFRAK